MTFFLIITIQKQINYKNNYVFLEIVHNALTLLQLDMEHISNSSKKCVFEYLKSIRIISKGTKHEKPMVINIFLPITLTD